MSDVAKESPRAFLERMRPRSPNANILIGREDADRLIALASLAVPQHEAVDDAFALVLFFETDADRQDMAALCMEAKPGLRAHPIQKS